MVMLYFTRMSGSFCNNFLGGFLQKTMAKAKLPILNEYNLGSKEIPIFSIVIPNYIVLFGKLPITFIRRNGKLLP